MVQLYPARDKASKERRLSLTANLQALSGWRWGSEGLSGILGNSKNFWTFARHLNDTYEGACIRLIFACDGPELGFIIAPGAVAHGACHISCRVAASMAGDNNFIWVYSRLKSLQVSERIHASQHSHLVLMLGRNSPAEQQAAGRWLNDFAEMSAAPYVALDLLKAQYPKEVQFFTANMLLTAVKRRWARLDGNLQQKIRSKLRCALAAITHLYIRYSTA